MTALLKGRAVHSILEVFPKKSSHKLADKYQIEVDKFINSDLGKTYLLPNRISEYRFGIDSNLEPCSYNDKSCLFRGIIDCIVIIDNRLYLVDYKTGKLKEPRWQEYDQLMFYSIYFFQKYNKIEHIDISYLYVEHDSENKITLERKYLDRYVSDLTKIINELEFDSSFDKNKTKLCDWCEYKEYCDLN